MSKQVIAQIEFDRIVRTSSVVFNKNVPSRMDIQDSLVDRTVKGITVERIYLRGSDLTETYFLGCTFKEVNFRDSIIKRTSFRDCKFIDCAFNNMPLVSVDFDECTFEGTNFSLSEMYYSTFNKCIIENCFFNSTDLRDSSFTKCKIVKNNFSKSNTKGVNGFHSIDNVGTFNGRITFHKESRTVWAGCWSGNLVDFEIKCRNVILNLSENSLERVVSKIKEELEFVVAFFKMIDKREV